jgi:hypothetical protein
MAGTLAGFAVQIASALDGARLVIGLVAAVLLCGLVGVRYGIGWVLDYLVRHREAPS